MRHGSQFENKYLPDFDRGMKRLSRTEALTIAVAMKPIIGYRSKCCRLAIRVSFQVANVSEAISAFG